MSFAEIIAIGSELLLGGRQDTNSLYLTDALASIGVEVRYKSIVGDDVNDIASAVQTASCRAKVVVTTGGLGPTADDCTREAVARATRRKLLTSARAMEMMQQRLAQWGRTPHPRQGRQALIPSGAELLRNPVGSAPGFLLRWKGAMIAALPGVPAEAEQMFHLEVLPRLSRTRGVSRRGDRITRRVLNTFGLVESEVEERLKGVLPPKTRVRLGLLASPLGVSVSFTSRFSKGTRLASPRSGPSQSFDAFSQDLDSLVRMASERLGSHVYGDGGVTLEEVIGQQLVAGRLTLALAESCTGGLIGHRITQVPGSSAYLDRGVICYSDAAKQELLGVSAALLRDYGAVSAEVAAAMAEGIRIRSRSGIGLSVTGIAGPTGGTEHKPVGLVYVGIDSASTPAKTITEEFRFSGARHMIKLRASQAALNLLRLYLANMK